MEMWQLQQRQSLPLEAKVNHAKQVIKQYLDYYEDMCYVSFSGGLDSTVLVDIAIQVYKNIPIVYVDTGLEYPENRDFVKTFGDRVIWLKPKMTFKQVIEKYGYPVISKEQSSFIEEYRNTKSEKLKNIRINGNKSGRGKISKKHLYLLDAPFKISDKCCDYIKKKTHISI